MWLAHHQTIWCPIKRYNTSSHTPSLTPGQAGCMHILWAHFMLIQFRHLWVIPIEQQQEVKTGQCDSLSLCKLLLKRLSLFVWLLLVDSNKKAVKADFSFASVLLFLHPASERHKLHQYAFLPPLSFNMSTLKGPWEGIDSCSGREKNCPTLCGLDW